MSFISSQVTPGGIVMSADRCTSAYALNAQGRPALVSIGRNAEKIHVTQNNIGISSCGAGSVGNVPMEQCIYEFIYGLDYDKYKTPFDVAQKFRDYIRNLDPKINADFQIGGYDMTDKEHPKPALYRIDMPTNTFDKANHSNLYEGAYFSSPSNFTYEIFKRIKFMYAGTNIRQAVDFAKFASETTRLMMRFSGEGDSISKEIDLLIIKPFGHEWVEA